MSTLSSISSEGHLTWSSSSGTLTTHMKMSWLFFNLLDLNNQTISWDMRGMVMRESSMAMVLNGNNCVPNALRFSSAASSIWKWKRLFYLVGIKSWYNLSNFLFKMRRYLSPPPVLVPGSPGSEWEAEAPPGSPRPSPWCWGPDSRRTGSRRCCTSLGSGQHTAAGGRGSRRPGQSRGPCGR